MECFKTNKVGLGLGFGVVIGVRVRITGLGLGLTHGLTLLRKVRYRLWG